MRKLALFCSIASISLVLILTSTVLAQEDATSSSNITTEELTQNARDRLKKFATQSASLTKQKRKIAFIGSIEKIANDTITLKTSEEIKLASVSASTTYSRQPNSSSDLEDVMIGDYAVAMGFINGSEVLETKRILLYEIAPQKTKKTSVAGLIKYIDDQENSLIIVADGEEIELDLTTKTSIYIQNGVEQDEVEIESLKPGQYVAAIYIPVDDEYNTPKALAILATNIIRSLPEIEASPSSPSASPQTQTPPAEFGR